MTMEQQQVEQAEKILGELQDRREELIGRAAKLDTERRALSYAAATGDAAALKKMRGLNDAVVVNNTERETLDVALAEAADRLQVARQQVSRAIDREQAHKLKAAAARLVELGAILDDCWTDIISTSSELRDLVNIIHGLGSPGPNHDQVRVLGANAVKAGLMNTLWAREFEHIAPHQRCTFASLVNSWSQMIENNVAARLGEQPQTSEAAA
jgi:chromosome segregation ATPase